MTAENGIKSQKQDKILPPRELSGEDSTKRCFVTVGATASFHRLIKAVLDITFLEALHEHDYTELRLQYGKDSKKTYEDYTWVLPKERMAQLRITITGFDFDQNGLRGEMLAAKRVLPNSGFKGKEGCVISHAGSGSILDALRMDVPLIVVPNPDLLHNHQLELAEALADQKYVVHGQLKNLATALSSVEVLRKQMRSWPPVSGNGKLTPDQALNTVMNDEMGWLD